MHFKQTCEGRYDFLHKSCRLRWFQFGNLSVFTSLETCYNGRLDLRHLCDIKFFPEYQKSIYLHGFSKHCIDLIAEER